MSGLVIRWRRIKNDLRPSVELWSVQFDYSLGSWGNVYASSPDMFDRFMTDLRAEGII